jgi:hypothetical protein
MASLNQNLLLEVARQRLQATTLPAGADKTQLNNYLGGISKAIVQAFQLWQSTATLTGVTIHAVIATGGKLSGPALEPLIRAQAPAGQTALNNAIAAGVHNQMKAFESQVKVPGLPWYPAFAAFPSPVAPPMPNVPCPLVTIAGPASQAWKASAVAAAIVQKFGNPKPPGGDAVARAVAEGLEKAVQVWLGATVVKNVMGSGPVPTFAPPYVPVGPVVGGTGNMTPGGLA